MILSSAYFPPVEYFSKIIKSDILIIEKYENYSKQSYRNRCNILSPNGIKSLTIPIKKISGKKILIKDIEIDYSIDWQKNHFKSLYVSYKSSPFYEYYIDAFIPFFNKKYKFLLDFNTSILSKLLSELGIDKKNKYTTEFMKKYPQNDFRYTIHPKIKPEQFQKEYTQVFSEKLNFSENLSILDLLFNEGTDFYKFL